MTSKLLCALAVLLPVAGPAAATQLIMGDVTMVATAGANSVTLDLEIRDDGGVPDCQYFLIRRYYWPDVDNCYPTSGTIVYWFPRVFGTTVSKQFVDTDVVANATYWYYLESSYLPPPLEFLPGCDQAQFRAEFGSAWGGPFSVPVAVGPGPPLVFHGTLYDHGCGFDCSGVIPCCDRLSQVSFLSVLPEWAKPYADTEVDIYGEYTSYVVQWGWEFEVTQLVPRPCQTVSTEHTTWGHVKSMYR